MRGKQTSGETVGRQVGSRRRNQGPAVVMDPSPISEQPMADLDCLDVRNHLRWHRFEYPH